ncbi:hypothetical protein IYZ83_005165 [Wolbachia pipientis]|nr:hypothetical protein [Wolbachia pipientis]UIP91516.1 hypothetical protein IYZ83_005165 [Wolbachia pipientis]
MFVLFFFIPYFHPLFLLFFIRSNEVHSYYCMNMKQFTMMNADQKIKRH